MTRVKAAGALIARLWTGTPRLRAHTTLIAGGAGTALGAALIYLPAGVILAGIELVVYGGMFVDVDAPKKRG